MSSKYDQSGTEPSFLPPQGLPLQSSNPPNKRVRVAPDVSCHFQRQLTIPSQSHFQKTFLLNFFKKMGICKTCDFLTTLSYVGNLFTSRRPRCSKVFFVKVRGKVESSFFILYTQAFYKWPVNLPKGWWALPICQMWYVILPFLSSKIKVYSGTKTNRPKAH